jgi:1-acyl-sn-glycerol-3-phosphate acyltransferase
MRVLKNILGRIYAVWMLVWFVITILLVSIPVVICHYTIRNDTRRTYAIMKWYRIWMDVYLPLIFCPIRKKGLSNFHPGENYVVVCNHNALVDILVSTPSVPGASKTLAKAELARIPVFGLVYKSGSILVDRKDPKSRRKSLDAMKKVLREGMHLVLYPEGTRNKTSEPLKSFYDGAFNIAIEAQKPIIPALIFHTKSILPPGKFFYAWPHAIPIHFLEPVSTEGLTTRDTSRLKEQVFRIMQEYYVKNSPHTR